MNEMRLLWRYSSFRHSGKRGGRGWKGGGDESDVVSRGEGHQGNIITTINGSKSG